MPGSTNTSFIPKHTPNKSERRNNPKQLFLGTVIVRVLFFAVMIASVGVFAYDRKLVSDLATEVKSFKDVSSSFAAGEEKVQSILSVDTRLMQANERFQKSLSMAAIFQAFEKTTIKTVQLKKLNIKKESDSEILVEADVVTDTFDSVIFQRSIFEENEVLKLTEFNEVTVQSTLDNEEEITPENLNLSPVSKSVSFQAKIIVDPASIPAVAGVQNAVPPTVPSPVPETVPATSTVSVDLGFSSPENI